MEKKNSRTIRNLQVFFLTAAIWLAVLAAPCLAEEEKGESFFSDLAREVHNPVSDRVSLTFDDNLNVKVGVNEDLQNIFSIKSLYSWNLGDKWNLVSRTIVPLIHQPALVTGAGNQFGLGDINSSFFLMPRSSRFAIFGIGPAVSFPTATNPRLGTEKWSVGPALALIAMPGPWVLGIVANNLWSVGGEELRKDVNAMTLKPILVYNFSKGWYATSSPVIQANWEAREGNRWTIPIGGGFGKIFKIGPQRMNASAQVFYNIKKPVTAGDWSFRVALQFLFEN